MIPYVPDARSPILNASHILRVRVLGSRAGEWAPRPGFGVQRDVALTLVLEEVLKGDVQEADGARIQLAVTQADTGLSRTTKMPGVWSDASIEPDARHIAFGAAPGTTSAPTLLTDPACRWLMPAEVAAFDVSLAREVSGIASIDAVATRVSTSVSGLNAFFPEFLIEWRGREIVMIPPAFGRIAGVLEAPELSPPGRAMLLQELDRVINLATPPLPTMERYVRALFRLLEVPEAAELHDNVLTSSLPAVIRHVMADRVFADESNARMRLRSLLRDRAGAEVVLKWLE